MEENTDYESSTQDTRTIKDTLRSGSPDEVRDKMKDVVQKGVAAVAGALKGFTEESQKSKIPETTRTAIQQAGETARTTMSTVADEVRGLKEPLRDAGQKLSSTARDLTSSVRGEARNTKDALSSSSSSTSSSSLPDSSSSLGSTYGEGSSMGMGGSALGSDASSSTDVGSEFPDISATPLAESDKKLQGKDLTEDLES